MSKTSKSSTPATSNFTSVSSIFATDNDSKNQAIVMQVKRAALQLSNRWTNLQNIIQDWKKGSTDSANTQIELLDLQASLTLTNISDVASEIVMLTGGTEVDRTEDAINFINNILTTVDLFNQKTEGRPDCETVDAMLAQAQDLIEEFRAFVKA